MIDIDTVLFIEKLRDLAKMSVYGVVPFSQYSSGDKRIIYDDNSPEVYAGDFIYPVVCSSLGNYYDTDDSTFRVHFSEDGPYIIVNIIGKEDQFMITRGEWFSI